MAKSRKKKPTPALNKVSKLQEAAQKESTAFLRNKGMIPQADVRLAILNDFDYAVSGIPLRRKDAKPVENFIYVYSKHVINEMPVYKFQGAYAIVDSRLVKHNTEAARLLAQWASHESTPVHLDEEEVEATVNSVLDTVVEVTGEEEADEDSEESVKN